MKRITALFLAMLLIVGVLPITGYAEEGPVDQPAQQPAGGYMNLAYAYNPSLTQVNTTFDWSSLTHVCVAFGLVYNKDYELGKPSSSRESWNTVNTNPELEHTVYLSPSNRTSLARLIERRDNEFPHLKVLLSVGGDGARGFSTMTKTKEDRAKFLTSLKAIVDEYKLDGIDLDWEFPCMDGWQNLNCSPDDRDNYTALVREARALFGEDILITMAGSNCMEFSEWWVDLEALGELFSFMNLMSYDMHYNSNYFGYNLGSSKKWITEIHPKNWVEADHDKSTMDLVEAYVSAGFPREKILIGYKPGSVNIPGYHQSEPEHKWGWLSNALSASGWSQAPYNAYPTWRRVDEALDGKTFNGTSGGVTKQIEFHKEWDRYAGIAVVYAYDLTDDPERTDKLFVFSYMDEQGLEARADYIKETGLRGAFFWAFSNDVDNWAVKTLAKKLSDPVKSPAPAPDEYMNLAYIYNGTVANMDFNALTHVDYAFGLIYNTEYQRTGKSKESWNTVNTNPGLEHTVYVSTAIKNNILKINEIKAERNLDLKVLLSIGGDGARGFSAMASTAATRKIFIDSCMALVEELSLDGLDLDWEFPCMDGWGHGLENSPEDKDNFTALVREMRAAIGDDKLLTMAGSADFPFTEEWVDLAELMKYFNFINLMTYDFQYGSTYFRVLLNSPRWWPAYNIIDDNNATIAVNHYVAAGCPRNKINIGYTTGRQTLPGDIQALAPDLPSCKNWPWVNAALTASNWNSAANGALDWQRIENGLDGKTFSGTSGGITKQIEFHRQWDRFAGMATVIAYNLTDDPERTEKLFVMSYHDKQGLDARTNYIKQNGLRGSFFWQYGGDTNSWLAQTVGENLGTYTYVSLNKNELLLEVNGSETLTAYIAPVIAADNSVIWSSSNDKVATVSASGEVTAKGSGQCVITATTALGGFSQTCDVKVSDDSKRVVGYMMINTSGNNLTRINFSNLDYVNLSFMNFSANGTFAFSGNPSDANVKAIVDRAHAAGTKVFISIGGGGGFSQNTLPFYYEKSREYLVNCILEVVDKFGLDGVDMDAETDDIKFWDGYPEFIKLLRDGIDARDLELSIAVHPWFTDLIDMVDETGDIYNYYDFFNVMSYDCQFAQDGTRKPLSNTQTDQAPMWHTYQFMDHYEAKGIPREKLNVGLPFYYYRTGTNWSARAWNASNIDDIYIDTKPGESKRDAWWRVNQQKSYLGATEYGGVMIWQLAQDSYNSESIPNMLEMVHQTVKNPYGMSVPPIDEEDKWYYEMELNPYTDLPLTPVDRESTQPTFPSTPSYGSTTPRVALSEYWWPDAVVGKQKTITVLSDTNVEWSVRNIANADPAKSSIISVDAGVITALAPGCATVDVMVDGVRVASVNVKVTDAVAGLTWPFTAVEWVLDKMAGIDINTYDYQQYDDVVLVKRSLGIDRHYGSNDNGTAVSMGSSGVNLSAADRLMFTQPDGQYYALYQKLLDQEAQMVKLWLKDFATLRPGEDWQNHRARIAQLDYVFNSVPGVYKNVEASRRLSILGYATLGEHPDYIKTAELMAGYEAKFTEECYKPGKEVEKLIDYMDPSDPAQVAAARAAYDALDNLAKSCVMNHEKITRAEGKVYADGSDMIPDNLKYAGMRKPTGRDTAFTAPYHKQALADLQEALPGTTPWYIWIAGTSDGVMRIGLPNNDAGWAELQASGALKYPIEYYKAMGISLNNETDATDEFFTYLDTIPGSEVYIQVENMTRLVEPQMDVLSYLAKKYECVKGFAIDVEWYNYTGTDCGLKISDYRAQILNEDIYSHWGPEYSLVLKHYDAGHFPDTYRGGGDGKSNPIIFVDDGQGAGSWDGTHGGQYAAKDTGNGNSPGYGGSWVLLTQYVYPNPVIFQTGYANDSQWIYNFEDPMITAYGSKIADVLAPDQVTGVAWVNFDRNDPRVFPNQTWRTLDQQVSDLAARSINYLRDYAEWGANLIGGNWGYGVARPNNDLTVHDAQMIRNTRVALQKLVAKGANPNGFTGHAQYPRFVAVESRALDIRIAALYNKIVTDAANSGGYKAARDLADIQALIDTYNDFTEAQKEAVVNIDAYEALVALTAQQSVQISKYTDTLTAGFAANVRVEIAGDTDGLALTAAIIVDDKTYSASFNGNVAMVAIPLAADIAAGDYAVKVMDGGTALDSKVITVIPLPEKMWSPDIQEDGNDLIITFAADITPGTKGYGAAVNGTAVQLAAEGANALRLKNVALKDENTLSISGVKYNLYFPSYSFTFNLEYNKK